MFSFDTINNFDEHIDSSIPNYSLLVDSVLSLSKYFVDEENNVVDIGCSTGKLLEAIPHKGNKIGIDESPNLCPAPNDKAKYVCYDIREINLNEFGKSSLILSIFTLQFIPRINRLMVLSNIYENLTIGGAFIWAEKVYGETGIEQELMNFAHYDFKRRKFTSEEILDKEQDLRELMRPNTSSENERLAQNAGFDKGIKFWKFFNFEATLYIK